MSMRSMAVVLALAGLLGACASWPGGSSVTRPPAKTASGSAEFDAAWDGEVDDAAQWTEWLSQAIDREGGPLLAATPTDIAAFCPRYAQLAPRDRKQVWILLISGIAERESSFDARASRMEPLPLSERSIGLMQLSLTDAEDFGCRFTTEAQIESPADNLECGVHIMALIIAGENLIGGDRGHIHQGVASYWAVLNDRPHWNARAVIRHHTRSMPACRPAR